VDYPLHAVEPKVMVPFENPPDGIPRKIVIERKRRLFEQQNIQELLKNEGVEFKKTDGNASFLPLEMFDNTEFDCRTPAEWISLAKDGDVLKYVPAKGLFFDNDANGLWRDCKVVACNEEENRYKVEVDFLKDAVWLPRLYILFKAEDPFVFAKRMAHAFQSRKKAEAKLVRKSIF